MITELVGPAGIGKTQACLMMAAQACLPASLGGLGEDAGVVYLDTERKVCIYIDKNALTDNTCLALAGVVAARKYFCGRLQQQQQQLFCHFSFCRL